MKIVIYFILLTFLACNIKTDCKSLEPHYRFKESCSMIVEFPPKPSSVYFEATGKNLVDGKPCKCKEESRWWATFSDQIKKGDTIIKRKGELIFYIHKKDTILKYNWECNGKIYN